MQHTAAQSSLPARVEFSKKEVQDVVDRVESVEGTIWKVVRHYSRGLSREDREDLYAAGRVGAVVAAGRYDAARGASFNTYAIGWVRAYVVREVFFFWGRGRCRISRPTSRIFFQHGRARRRLEALQIDPTPEAVAEVLGVRASILRDVEAVRAHEPKAPTQGNRFEHGDHERELPRSVAVEPSASALESLCARADVDEVRAALDKLNARQRYVLRQRFYENKKLREIADALGVTRERVRQLEAAALQRLRRLLSYELT